MYTYIAILAFLQAPLVQAAVPLLDQCSSSGRILAQLEAAASAKVRFSMAGDEKTCYSVTALVNGTPINGYVQGNDLAAVAEFERQRALASVAARPPSPAASAPTAEALHDETQQYPDFNDFVAVDMKGRPVNAHSLKGKINLVSFWSPSNAGSSRELLSVERLYGQLKARGVDALAVSLSRDSGTLQDTLDDYHLGFRNVPNGYDIAPRYNITYASLPITYVLTSDFKVIASGLHGKALEDLVKKLVAAK